MTKAKKYANDTFDNESIHTGVYIPNQEQFQRLDYEDDGIQLAEKHRDDTAVKVQLSLF